MLGKWLAFIASEEEGMIHLQEEDEVCEDDCKDESCAKLRYNEQELSMQNVQRSRRRVK